MARRYISIWFHHLTTDWFILRQPSLHTIPFVLALPDHGRMIVTAANLLAEAKGVSRGMTVADARAIIPGLQVIDEKPGLSTRLLKRFAEWFIRYSPCVAMNEPDGLIIEATGCTHLWGGEKAYLDDVIRRMKKFGYQVRAAMADTIGTAWATAHFGQDHAIIPERQQMAALLPLPVAALRLEEYMVDRLQKLGLYQIRNIVNIPRASLERRFGNILLAKLDCALGYVEEAIQPVQPVIAYQERLPCLEPISTATGIEIALQRLLETLCYRLSKEEKGLRTLIFKGFRIDGQIVGAEIGTTRPTHNTGHLFKLFESKIPGIEPALGIELFTLEAQQVEEISPLQERLWEGTCSLHDIRLSELIDRFMNRFKEIQIRRYLPDEHHWPERSIKQAASLQEKPAISWNNSVPRPLHLLVNPERIEVTAPLPDYPPMLFRYKGKLHTIKKADGPERIEREWWLEEGHHRDYYRVEDENGCRYWLFRSGHYSLETPHQWFIHGFFA